MILLSIEIFGPGGINFYARPLIGLTFSLENIIIQLFMLSSLYSLIIFVFQKYGVMFRTLELNVRSYTYCFNLHAEGG